MNHTIPWRMIAFIVGLFLALGLTGLTVRSCTKARQAAAETRVERAGADALANSAADAVGAVGGLQTRDLSGDQTTRENDDAIRSAPGAGAPVDPAVRGAGIDSLCKRAAYRDDRRCVQRAPAP